MLKKIYHTSDIHIKNGLYDDIINAFNKLVDSIVKSTDRLNSALVIAGDIFENKTTLTQYDIRCFLTVINNLVANNILTIIIPGNHDYSRKNELDLLSPLLMNNGEPIFPNIFCYPKSGVYTHGEVEFHVLSPIDGEIPDVTSPSRVKKIAIAHETIIGGIRYGNIRATQARLGPNSFKAYNMTLLGDLHKYQYFGKYQQIAYCGSLVQKDRSEDLFHGYIKWDVATGSHEFVPIPLRSAYIRLVVKDDIKPVMPNLLAKEIIVEHTKCTKEFIDELYTTIVDKYGPLAPTIIKDRNPRLIGDTNDEQGAVVIGGEEFNRNDLNLDTIDNQLNLMAAYLKSTGKHESIEQIHTIHRKYAKQQTIARRWKLHYIEWKNIVCYGEDNYVRFDDITKIGSILGKNKTGKSSIITALLFVLTNAAGRISTSTIDDLINKNSKVAYIKCVISIDDVEYQILNNMKESENTYILRDGIKITHNKSETYTELKNLLGTIDIFKMVSVKVQDMHTIADMKDTTLVKQFDMILGLDVLKSIRTQARSHVNSQLPTLKYRESNVGEPISAMEIAIKAEKKAINDYITEIAELKENREKISAHQKNLHNSIPQQYLLADIDDLKSTIKTSTEIVSNVRESKKIKDIEGVENLTTEIDKLNKLSDKYSNLLRESEKKYTTLLENRITLPEQHNIQLDLSPEEVDEKIKYLHSVIVPLREKQTKHTLTKLEILIQNFDFGDVGGVGGDKFLDVIDIDGDIVEIPDSYLTAIPKLDKYINKMQSLESQVDKNLANKIKDVEEKISKVSGFQKIKYNAGCSDCTENKKVINEISGLLNYEDQLQELQNRRVENDKVVREYEKVYKQVEKLKTYKAQHEKNQIIEKNNAAKLYNSKLQEYNILCSDRDQIKSERFRVELKSLELYKSMFGFAEKKEKHDLIEKDIRETKEAIATYRRKLNTAKSRLDYYNAYSSLNVLEDVVRKKELLTKVDNKIAKINNVLENCISDRKIAEIKMHDLIEKIKKRRQEDTEIEEIKNELAYFQEYEKMLDPTNLPFKIMKHSMDSIILTVNNLLNEIADFQISLQIVETPGKVDDSVIKKKLRINIHESNGVNERVIISSMGSGFQKFVIDLAFRIAFIKNVPSLPKFLIIDEGFGSLDIENRELAKNALHKIAYEQSYLDFILIISHQNEFNDISESHIKVKQVKNEKGIVSQVQFGEKVPDMEQTGEIDYVGTNSVTSVTAPATELSDEQKKYELSKCVIDEADKIIECKICNKKLVWKKSDTSRRSALKKHCEGSRHKTLLLKDVVKNNIK